MASYWYKKVVYSCPLCDYYYTKRVRVYGRKPPNKRDRVERELVFNFCERKKNVRDDDRRSSVGN